MTAPLIPTGQGVRTRQAWTRTVLASLLVVGIGLRLAVDRGAVATAVMAGAAAATAGFAVLAMRRVAQLALPEPPPLPAGTVLGVAAAVVVVDLAGLVLLVT